MKFAHLTLLLAVALAFALTHCGPSPAKQPASTGTAGGSKSSNSDSAGEPEASATTRRNVTIEAPEEGSTVTTNPITIRGLARTFENNVGIRVRDASGAVIVETHTTAVGEMGIFSPYTSEIFLTRMPSERLVLEAFETSAKDGSIESLVAVEVRYQAEPREIQLFFPNEKKSPGDCTRVFPIVRALPSTKSIARALVEALLDGPTPEERDARFSGPFPDGSAIRGINLRDGLATVDFNERLQNVGGSRRAQAIRAGQDHCDWKRRARSPAVGFGVRKP